MVVAAIVRLGGAGVNGDFGYNWAPPAPAQRREGSLGGSPLRAVRPTGWAWGDRRSDRRAWDQGNAGAGQPARRIWRGDCAPWGVYNVHAVKPTVETDAS